MYNLICFVKHDSWNDFGEGKRVILPVKIVQAPVQEIPLMGVDLPMQQAP